MKTRKNGKYVNVSNQYFLKFHKFSLIILQSTYTPMSKDIYIIYSLVNEGILDLTD